MCSSDLIVVLLLEQVRPLADREVVGVPMQSYARFFERHFNDGQESHGMVAWLLAVLPATIACAAIYFVLMAVSPLLGFAWNVAVLYLALGFRQFSHYYTDIHLALRMGETERARALLGEWRGRSADGLNATEIARLAMEEALVASHRHVFAVVVWFVLLPGPAGALMYRLAYYFQRQWGERKDAEFGAFGRFAVKAFAAIDWLPVRITAAAFAIPVRVEAPSAEWPEHFYLEGPGGALVPGDCLGEELYFTLPALPAGATGDYYLSSELPAVGVVLGQ